MATIGAVRGSGAFSISPNDVTDLPKLLEAIWVGGTGNLRVLTELDEDVTFNSVPVGRFDLVHIKRVFSTGTSASNLIGVY